MFDLNKETGASSKINRGDDQVKYSKRMIFLAVAVFAMGFFVAQQAFCAAEAADKTVAPAAEKLKAKSIGTDTNGDGKPDRWEYYNEAGVMTKIEADSNGDGKIDEWGTVENGKLVKVEKDSNYDGKPDKWVTY